MEAFWALMAPSTASPAMHGDQGRRKGDEGAQRFLTMECIQPMRTTEGTNWFGECRIFVMRKMFVGSLSRARISILILIRIPKIPKENVQNPRERERESETCLTYLRTGCS